MSASEAVRSALYKRAGGQCECTMLVCDHHSAGSRCPRGLVAPYWDVHRRVAGGSYDLSNGIAMCATCHKNTRTYGQH